MTADPASRPARLQRWPEIDEEDRSALPARPRTVVLYLAWLVREGLASSTIKTASAAIGKAHEIAGQRVPTDDPIVRRRRRRLLEGTAGELRVTPLTVEQVRQIIGAMDDDLADLRDRALLLVGYALRLRRSALVSLNFEDVHAAPEGLELIVKGRRLLLPRGSSEETCPVRALQAWIRVADPQTGPLFLRINRWGRPGGRLSATSASVIVQQRAAAAGLSIKGVSADSLHMGPPDDRRLLRRRGVLAAHWIRQQ